MAGNTYKWVGGNGGSADPNDASVVANWLVQQGNGFVAASALPGNGDSAIIDTGAADILALGGSPSDILGVTFLLGGTGLLGGTAGATLAIANATLDIGTSVQVAAGDLGTLALGGTVLSGATIEAQGVGATLDIALSGAFESESLIAAEAGGAVTLSVQPGGTLINQGALLALGGDLTVSGTVGGSGLLVVGDGTLEVTGGAAGADYVVFTQAPAMLVVDSASQFSARILAFQAGDTIDLTGIADATLHPLQFSNNTLTLNDGTHTAQLVFPGVGFGSGNFATTADPHGGTYLTVPLVVDPSWQLAGPGADWSDAAAWSTGTAPGAASTAVIAVVGGTQFTITATDQQANALVMLTPTGQLDLAGSFTVGHAVFETVGSIQVAASGTLSAKSFNMTGGGATLTMLAGATMSLSGGGVVSGNGTSALETEGVATLQGTTLLAGAGSARIGWTSSGTLDLSAGASGTVDHTVLGNFNTADGTLSLDGSQWRDAGGDASAPQSGMMVVGASGSAFLSVTDDATLTDQSGAIVGENPGSSGFVLVQDGGTWNVGGNLIVGDAVGAIANLSLFAGPSLHSGGTVTVAQTVALDGTLQLDGGSLVTALALSATGGSLSVDGSSLIAIGGGSADATGLWIAAGASADLAGGASFAGLADVLGSLVTAGATLNGTLSGDGTVQIASGTTLVVNDAPAWTTPMAFAGGGGTLRLAAPQSEQGALLGFVPSSGTFANTIDLPGLAWPLAQAPSFDAGTGVLTVADTALHLGAGAAGDFSVRPDGGGGTEVVSIPCYVAGTAIATPGGDMAVEHLRPGDLVMVQSGAGWQPQPVRWVGRMTVDLARHPAPHSACPIRLRAHCVAPGVPARDLLLSPDHAVLINGVLMQAQALANGASIAREPPVGRVIYVHVELDRHGILLAEGMPAESYLDTGNRASFAGEPGVRPLHLDLAAPRAWRRDACATLVLAGPPVVAAHARLLARARALGWHLVPDPALRLRADGAPLAVQRLSPRHWRAEVPAGTRDLALLSRCFIPDEQDRAANDRRRLGVPVAALRLGGRALPPLAYAGGWHAPEPAWRWTDGAAHLRLRPGRQARWLNIEMAAMLPGYWHEGTRAMAWAV